MRRQLFALCSALSLLLFAATAALWAWSYAQPSWQFAVRTSPRVSYHRELGMGNGYAGVATIETFPLPAGIGGGYPYGGDTSGWNFLGLRVHRHRITLMRPDSRSIVAVVNRTSSFTVWLGLPLLLSAILPVWWLLRRRKDKRDKQKGACRVCGYDLRKSREVPRVRDGN